MDSGAEQKKSKILQNPYSNHIYRRCSIKDILGDDEGQQCIGLTGIVVGGWVRTGRTAEKGALTFLEINDGSCVHSMQVLVQSEVKAPDEIKSTGVCIVVEGEIKAAPEGAKQKMELHATSVLHVGPCDAKTYPMAKSKLGLEFLREKIHLRVRTNTIASIQRVRNCLAYATHKFFQTSGFQYVHTPLITASDCEGAGEMFQVTTLLSHADAAGAEPPSPEKIAELKASASACGSAVADKKKELAEGLKSKDAATKAAATAELKPVLDQLMAAKKLVEEAEEAASNVGGLPRTKDGKIDYSKDFFGQMVNLTVSGQLQVVHLARVVCPPPPATMRQITPSLALCKCLLCLPVVAGAHQQRARAPRAGHLAAFASACIDGPGLPARCRWPQSKCTHCLTFAGRDLRVRHDFNLHVWTHVPGGELAHYPAFGGVLDDRAGDRLC